MPRNSITLIQWEYLSLGGCERVRITRQGRGVRIYYPGQLSLARFRAAINNKALFELWRTVPERWVPGWYMVPSKCQELVTPRALASALGVTKRGDYVR